MIKELTEKQVSIARKWLHSGWEEGYKNVPDDEAICIIRYTSGEGEVEARFILGIERGEIDGDVQAI